MEDMKEKMKDNGRDCKDIHENERTRMGMQGIVLPLGIHLGIGV